MSSHRASFVRLFERPRYDRLRIITLIHWLNSHIIERVITYTGSNKGYRFI